MIQKFTRTMCAGLMLGLILMATAPMTWATTYRTSKWIGKKGGGIAIVWSGPNKVYANIPKRALKTYLDEQGVTEVEITIQMTETLVERADGSRYYRLDFTFGPSGAHFEPELKLRLEGKYSADDTEVWLYDEYGEAVTGKRHNGKGEITFYIPHFSEYSYDDYY